LSLFPVVIIGRLTFSKSIGITGRDIIGVQQKCATLSGLVLSTYRAGWNVPHIQKIFALLFSLL